MNRGNTTAEVQHPAPGLAQALLPEIAELLQDLADSGAAAAIDLKSLPMSDGDKKALAQRLGRGEVFAYIDVAGHTEIWETSYPGLWWVRHLGADGAVAAEQLSITRVPEILQAHSADILAAAARLHKDLAFGNDHCNHEEVTNV